MSDAPGNWARHDFPKHDWSHEGVTDLGPERFTNCEMCGRERIRYVHHLTHEGRDMIQVGYVCAGKMTGDAVEAEVLEEAVKNRTARRENWLSRNWSLSSVGNPTLTSKGYKFVVFKSKFGGGWSASITSTAEDDAKPKYVRGNTVEAAALAAFDLIWPTAATYALLKLKSPKLNKGEV